MLTTNQILAVTRRRLQERGLHPETVRTLLMQIGHDMCELQEQEDRERLSNRHKHRRHMTTNLIDRQVNEYHRDMKPEMDLRPEVYNPEYSNPFPEEQYVV